MMIIGCDYHPSWEQVAWLDTETGETGEQKLVHAAGEAEVLPAAVRRQKTDKRDAAHILKLLVEGRFPRLWTPDRVQRDLRQLLIHRQKLVQIRARVKNGLQHLALNQGVQKKARLWSAAGQKLLRELPLQPWAGRRRQDLLGLLRALDEHIAPLDRAVAEAAQRDEMARLLMTQPGVGPVTALCFVLTIGDVKRFPRGKQVASYLGLIPRERSSAAHQRLGAITKQGNRMARMPLVEAAQSAVRSEFRQQFLRRSHRMPRNVAKVAAARKLAVRLYWMLRSKTAYPEVARIESSPRVPLVGAS